MDAYARARELIDAAHAADPTRTADGRPAELVYADPTAAWAARPGDDPVPARARVPRWPSRGTPRGGRLSTPNRRNGPVPYSSKPGCPLPKPPKLRPGFRRPG